MGPDEMCEIAGFVRRTLEAAEPAGISSNRFRLEPAARALVREAASELAKRFPPYPGVEL
jgi:hypothetical protein